MEYNKKSEKVTFASKNKTPKEKSTADYWKIMVVDDDEEVHMMTKIVLDDIIYASKRVKLISAHSGKEAVELLKKNPDTAIILLDVIMETDNSGLLVAKEIREVLKNFFIRIILRTGQPGHAPERDVILDYDINDYKTKSELTAQKLFTAIVSSLRAYRDIKRIYQSKQGLLKIIESSTALFKLQSMGAFVTGILTQLTSILDLKKDSMFCLVSGFYPEINESEYILMAGTGRYEEEVNKQLEDVAAPGIIELVKKAYTEQSNIYKDNCSIFFFKTTNNSYGIVYVENSGIFDDLGKKIIDLFCKNISIAFDNIYQFEKLSSRVKEK